MYKLVSASKNSYQSYEYSKDEFKKISSLEIQGIKQTIYSPGNQLLVNSSRCTIDEEFIDHSVDLCCFGYRSARILYIACNNDGLILYDVYRHKITDSIKVGDLKCITCSCDDSKIAGGLANGNVFIYSLKYKTSTVLETKSVCNSLCFYPFKKSILLCGFENGSVCLFDLLKGTTISEKMVAHSAPASGVCFAPCNKHFYCSISLDGSVLFHDISFDANGKFTQKGILQSYQSEHSLLCISINDEHVVAMGNSIGQILIYDLRSKNVTKIIVHGTTAILGISFQAPQWSINAAAKEFQGRDKLLKQSQIDNIKSKTPAPSLENEIKSVEINSGEILQTAECNAMDMFSPVNDKKHDSASVSKPNLQFQERLAAKSAKDDTASNGRSIHGSSRFKKILPSKFKFDNDQISEVGEKRVGGLVGINYTSNSTTNDPILPKYITPIQKTFRLDLEKNVREPSDSTSVEVPLDTALSDFEFHKNEKQDRGENIMNTPKAGRLYSPPAMDHHTPITLKLDPDIVSARFKTPLINQKSTSSTENHTTFKAEVKQFEYLLIKNIVADVIEEQTNAMTENLQNVHLDMIRQFQIQKNELQAMYKEQFEELVTLVKDLKDENTRMRVKMRLD